MLIEIKDFWYVETSTVDGIRLDVRGWWRNKYPVIIIERFKAKNIILSDFDNSEALQKEFERLVKLFNEWEVFLNKHHDINKTIRQVNKVTTKQVSNKESKI